MARPAKWRSRRGLLLVEAGLAAGGIAGGLGVFPRGFSSHVRALRTVEEYDILVPLARGKLHELEASRIFEPKTSSDAPSGEFAPPYDMYEWRVSAMLREEPGGESPTSRVELNVRRKTPPAYQVHLSTVWPTDEVPPGWY